MSDMPGMRAFEDEVRRLAATKAGFCPSYTEAPECCDCIVCRTLTLLAEWEDHPLFAANLTQPVPGNSGGVEEALELLREDEALNRLAVYVFRYMLSYDEAITDETAMSAALDHVAAALERTDRNPDQIRESLEAEAAAASTQPPSPQGRCRVCLGPLEGAPGPECDETGCPDRDGSNV